MTISKHYFPIVEYYQQDSPGIYKSKLNSETSYYTSEIMADFVSFIEYIVQIDLGLDFKGRKSDLYNSCT